MASRLFGSDFRKQEWVEDRESESGYNKGKPAHRCNIELSPWLVINHVLISTLKPLVNLDQWHLNDYLYNRINSHHIYYCFLFVAFVLFLFLSSTVFLPFMVLNEHLTWFLFLSILLIVILLTVFSCCPRVHNIHLQLIQVHFQIIPYPFTGSLSTL